MASLALYLLGSPRVELDGAPIAIDRRKALALLVYLVVTRQDHSRDALATLLWPEYDQSKARAGLRSALWSLVKALGEGHLDVERESVRLKDGADAWLDVDAFQDRLQECRTHDHPPDQVCPECLSSLAEAAALYRDDFLAGFTLPDSPGFDEWQFFQTQSLRQDLASALERLAHGHGEQGEYEGAITQARRWVALDPLHEPAQRLLMRLYAWSGQRAAALRQYEECTRALQYELGVPPDEETTQLFQAIKEKLELPPTTEHPATPTFAQAARPKHNLPVQLIQFVGRKAALVEIAGLLRDPACRLLTLVGPGGSGKTRLALEAAAGILSQPQLQGFEHGIFFVSLAPLDEMDQIVPAVAQALGFSFYGGVEPRQQLLDYLRQRHVLLILDNFEHLLAPPSVPPSGGDERGGAALVTAMLKAAPALKILTTSRTVLNVQGEHLFSVPGMDLPDQETHEDVLAYSAVKLFLQGAHRAHPGFEPTDAVLQDVVRVCRRVEGMPLGILLAAGWVGMLTPSEIAAEIGRSLDFLETDLRDVPQRQRSMRAVFDHSWNLLSVRQRVVMRALSVFRGGFTGQAAQKITGASLRELRALVNRSLLQRDPGGRYAIHELLRQYAAEKLERVPAEKEAARDRHCAYYAGFLQARKAHLLGWKQKRAAAEIEAELENVHRSWRWAVDQRRIGEIDRALETLAEFYWIRGRLQQGADTFAEAAESLAEEPESRSCSELIRGAAEPQEADAHREHRALLAEILLQQGRFLVMIGFLEQASEPLQQSLAIFRDLGTKTEIAYALRWLAHTASPADEQKRLYMEGLAIFEEIGNRRGKLLSLWGLGHVATNQGDYKGASQLYQECLTISRELGNLQGVADSLSYSADTSRSLGQYSVAKQRYQEAFALYKEIDDTWGTAYCLNGLALASKGLGDYGEAKCLLQESLALYTENGNPYQIAYVTSNLGDISYLLGEHIEAIKLARESLALFEPLAAQGNMALCYNILANATRALKDLQGARRFYHQALEMALNVVPTYLILRILMDIATLLAEEGEKEAALELLSLSLRHPASAQWTKDRATALLGELETELPPHIVAAAIERGRARDLDATVIELLAELEEETGADHNPSTLSASSARLS